MNGLVRIVKRHHLLVWAGAWTTVMVMAWGAIAILLNPNLGNSPASMAQHQQNHGAGIATLSQSHQQRDPSTARPPNDAALAFWAFGIVALTCGFGAIILSQQIKPARRR